MDSLVTTHWLADRLGRADLVVLDATYVAVQPDPPRDEAVEYAAGHIPGARFLDLRALSGQGRTSLPSEAAFSARLGELGMSSADRIVLYDGSPHRTSARAWWLFRLFAPDQPVAILDGGLDKWRRDGMPLDDHVPAVEPAKFVSDPDLSAVRTMAMVQANLTIGTEQLVDARSPARFAGSEPDPRGLPSGHIPGSVNLPYGRFFAEDGSWRPRGELAQLFADAGIDLDRPVVATCGSGITAAVPAFALHLLGRDPALYDGSWTEWAADPHTLKVTA